MKEPVVCPVESHAPLSSWYSTLVIGEPPSGPSVADTPKVSSPGTNDTSEGAEGTEKEIPDALMMKSLPEMVDHVPPLFAVEKLVNVGAGFTSVAGVRFVYFHPIVPPLDPFITMK